MPRDEKVVSDNENKEWPLWKCTALTAVICGLPLIFMGFRFPMLALLIWISLILSYLAFIRAYGPGHVIEAAIIVVIIAVLVVILIPAIDKAMNKNKTSSNIENTSNKRRRLVQTLQIKAVVIDVGKDGLAVVAALDHVLGRPSTK